MLLTLEALQILDAIDRRGSFAAAAQALDKVPSAITYSVRKLEDDMDVLLFDRRGHKARLTEAGQELLQQGRHLLQAAHELEQQVKRTANGWEAELRIVLDGIIQFDDLLPLLQEFSSAAPGTRLRISQQVLSGVWEAMVAGRADLAIGAAYDGPDAVRLQGELQARVMGQIDWVFAVAPSHPLAAINTPLSNQELQQHTAIAVGDTGLSLPGMSAGLLSGQAVIVVPGMAAKLAAQLAGLGCGHLPRRLALPHLQSGALIEKTLAYPRQSGQTHLVWRQQHRGKALSWFLDRLEDKVLQQRLLGHCV